MKPRDQKYFERVRKAAMSALAKRKPWEFQWQRIADAMLPYNVQICGRRDSANKAQRLDQEIVDDTPVKALDNLAAGLMARVTSPARKWFGIQAVSNGVVADLDSEARSYLDNVAEIVASDLERGGWYAVLSMSTYPDLGASGTAAIFMDEQPDGDAVFDAVPVGRFAIDCDHLGKVNTWVREWSATADQLKTRFGEDVLPERVKNALARNDSQTEFEVLHAVIPLDTPSPAGHAFSSTWWMVGATHDVLHEGGYYEFPALVPRWTVRPGDNYGRGPGWKALGSIRMLQHYTRGLVRLLDLKMLPPMWATNGEPMSYLPGTTTHVEAAAGQQVQTGRVVEVRAEDIAVVREQIAELQRTVDDAFYGNLWRAFTDDERAGVTATEIEAKRQELALLTGPLLESLNGELLGPCIERRLHMLLRRGHLPPLPESLQGAEIKIEFISIMHQMQQSQALLSYRSLIADVTGLAQIKPGVLDKIDGDAIVDELARATGVRADTLVSKDQLEQIRNAKAQAQQQQAASSQALALTQGVRNVSGADPQKIQDLAGMLAPAAAAQGGALAPVDGGS